MGHPPIGNFSDGPYVCAREYFPRKRTLSGLSHIDDLLAMSAAALEARRKYEMHDTDGDGSDAGSPSSSQEAVTRAGGASNGGGTDDDAESVSTSSLLGIESSDEPFLPRPVRDPCAVGERGGSESSDKVVELPAPPPRPAQMSAAVVRARRAADVGYGVEYEAESDSPPHARKKLRRVSSANSGPGDSARVGAAGTSPAAGICGSEGGESGEEVEVMEFRTMLTARRVIQVGDQYQAVVPPREADIAKARSVLHADTVPLWIPPVQSEDAGVATEAGVTAGLGAIWACVNGRRVTRPNVSVAAVHPLSGRLERAYTVGAPAPPVVPVVFRDAPTSVILVQLSSVRLERCGYIDTTFMSDELALYLLYCHAYSAERVVAQVRTWLGASPDDPGAVIPFVHVGGLGSLRVPPEGPWSVYAGMEFAREFTRRVTGAVSALRGLTDGVLVMCRCGKEFNLMHVTTRDDRVMRRDELVAYYYLHKKRLCLWRPVIDPSLFVAQLGAGFSSTAGGALSLELKTAAVASRVPSGRAKRAPAAAAAPVRFEEKPQLWCIKCMESKARSDVLKCTMLKCGETICTTCYTLKFRARFRGRAKVGTRLPKFGACMRNPFWLCLECCSNNVSARLTAALQPAGAGSGRRRRETPRDEADGDRDGASLVL